VKEMNMIGNLSSQISNYQSERRSEADNWRRAREAREASGSRRRSHSAIGSAHRSARH
jgi:hypothetical protein